MSSTVLVKVYPGTGRPNMFQVVDDNNTDEVERLCEGFQYSIVDTGKPDDIDPWDEYTYNDSDGFTQWAS